MNAAAAIAAARSYRSWLAERHRTDLWIDAQ